MVPDWEPCFDKDCGVRADKEMDGGFYVHGYSSLS